MLHGSFLLVPKSAPPRLMIFHGPAFDSDERMKRARAEDGFAAETGAVLWVSGFVCLFWSGRFGVVEVIKKFYKSCLLGAP